MSFKDLKKQSSLGSLTSKLVKEVENELVPVESIETEDTECQLLLKMLETPDKINKIVLEEMNKEVKYFDHWEKAAKKCMEWLGHREEA